MLSKFPKSLMRQAKSMWYRFIVDQFHKIYYSSPLSTWKNTYWLNTGVAKCPLDLWVYQEILASLKPDLIIESGTAYGGSALFLASLCDLLDHGEIVTIDIEDIRNRPCHKRIHYLTGGSTSDEIVQQVSEFASRKEKVMVLLDSDHSQSHVLEELRIYHDFVTPGSYLIIEDTNVGGHPVLSKFGPGPLEAVKEFLKENDTYVVDKGKEKFYLTFNPGGFLKRMK